MAQIKKMKAPRDTESRDRTRTRDGWKANRKDDRRNKDKRRDLERG
jgi:hypothetical protein